MKNQHFVNTMPMLYDRQLISDAFTMDDAFMDRPLMFQNGDWLQTSFKATNPPERARVLPHLQQ